MHETVSPPPTTRARPLPGTGRLGVVSAYFMLTGLYAAVIAIMIAKSIAGSTTGWTTSPANHSVALAGVSSLAYGCLRISRLLDRRRREGVIGAGLFLLAPLVGYVTGAPPSLLTLGVGGVGVVLLAGVWRHLR